MTKFIVQVDQDDARKIQWDYDHNEVWIGGWGEEKPHVEKLTRVTKNMIDAATDQIMDTITEGGYGETQLVKLRAEIRRVIKVMLFE